MDKGELLTLKNKKKMTTSVVHEIIKWAIENAFNVETKDGTHYIAIDYEEMRKNFDEWLEKDKADVAVGIK